MKRIVFIAIVLFATLRLYAQKNTVFYKHEVKVSVGDAIIPSVFQIDKKSRHYCNVAFSYLYRPEKWFWVGGNFVNYFGNRIYYNWREYDENGNFNDFSKSKMKYSVAIAPEMRFSYLNKKAAILYSSLSGGLGLENGYDDNAHKYPGIIPYFHLTYFGFSVNFGKDNNIFLGGELGFGYKGFGNIHGGYRF